MEGLAAKELPVRSGLRSSTAGAPSCSTGRTASRGCGRSSAAWTGGARPRSPCGRSSAGRAPAARPARTSLSSAQVASSSSRIGASRRKARAMASRWRWPPDSFTPRSPTIVSKPSDSAAMKSQPRSLRRRIHLVIGRVRACRSGCSRAPSGGTASRPAARPRSHRCRLSCVRSGDVLAVDQDARRRSRRGTAAAARARWTCPSPTGRPGPRARPARSAGGSRRSTDAAPG